MKGTATLMYNKKQKSREYENCQDGELKIDNKEKLRSSRKKTLTIFYEIFSH
jgi:hypothetical protein